MIRFAILGLGNEQERRRIYTSWHHEGGGFSEEDWSNLHIRTKNRIRTPHCPRCYLLPAPAETRMIVFWALSKASSWLCLSGSVGGTVCLLPNNLMMNKRTSIWSPAGLCVVCCYISQRPRIVDSMISELNPFCCDKPSVNRLLEPPRRSHDSFCDSRVSPEIMLILCVSILRACCTAPPHCHRRFFARALHCFGSSVGGCFQESPVFV